MAERAGSTLNFSGTLEPGDLVPAIDHIMRRSWLNRIVIAWCIILAISFIGNAILSGTPAGSMLAAIPILVAVWMLWGGPMQARSHMAQQKSLAEPGEYTFNAQGIRIIHPSLEVKFPWTAVQRIAELPEHYILMLTPKSFRVIPKRFLPGELDAEWRSLVTTATGLTIEKA